MRRKHRAFVALPIWLLASVLVRADDGGGETVESLLQQARVAQAAQRTDEALKLASRAIELAPDDVRGYVLRGELHAARRASREAIADFSRALELDDSLAAVYDQRGSEHFKQSDFAASIADFDRYLKFRPQHEPGHWRRGIAYYYAGQYRLGAEQFAAYQTFDDNDVENAVWRYLCMARDGGVESARRELLDIRGDRRVPMMAIYRLYRGEASPEDVFAAVDAVDLTPDQRGAALFYAHLYVGLWHESLGQMDEARQHVEQAARKYPIEHYMGDVARVHARLFAESDDPR